MNLSLLLIYFTNSIVLITGGYLGYQYIKKSALKPFYLPAIVFKLICTIGIGLLYTQYYHGGDILAYFQNANEIAQLSLADYWNEITSSTRPEEPRRAIYFARLLSVLLLITKSDFWLASVYFSLANILCSFYLLKQFVKQYSNHLLPAVIAFLFFPSVVFWSSGLLKESLALASMLCLSGLTLKVINQEKTRLLEIFLSIASIIYLFFIKYYIAFTFLPLLLLVIAFSFQKKEHQKTWFAIIGIAVVSFIVALPWFHPVFHPSKFIHFTDISRNLILQNSNPKSLIELYYGSNPFINSIINFFILTVSGVFRPFIFEYYNLFSFLMSVENLAILLLLISRFWGKVSIPKEQMSKLLLLSGYILIVALLLTYSTPSFGTLSRFKVYYMPFLLFIILIEHPLIHWLLKNRKRL